MYLEIKPTTTLTELRRNNTSASDSFPGWPNGVAKAAHIGNSFPDVPQAVLVHDVNWWGTKSHPNIGYDSADPAYIARKIVDFKHRGISGATWLWHGAQSQEHKACLAALPLYEQAGLKFCLMIGSSTPTLASTLTAAQRTANLINILGFFRSTFLKSANCLRLNDKPVVMFFGVTGVDWTAVSKAGADLAFMFRWEQGYSDRPEADAYFGWRSCDETWIAAVKKFGKPIMLGLNGGFDSSHKEAPILCSWGNTTTTSQQGGLRMKSQLDLARAHPEIGLAQLVTLNDYQEGSALEPGIHTGLTLLTDIYGTKLNWTPLSAAIDHVMVYISPDGENLMPLVGPIRGDVPGIDLAELEIPLGSWSFVVEGVGIHSVQNVLSNVITKTLGWN